MKDDKRMNYWHRCDCGREFEGFKYQHTCWTCIRYWLRYSVLKK